MIIVPKIACDLHQRYTNGLKRAFFARLEGYMRESPEECAGWVADTVARTRDTLIGLLPTREKEVAEVLDPDVFVRHLRDPVTLRPILLQVYFLLFKAHTDDALIQIIPRSKADVMGRIDRGEPWHSVLSVFVRDMVTILDSICEFVLYSRTQPYKTNGTLKRGEWSGHIR